MFQKREIKETVVKKVITAYYSKKDIENLIKADAEKQGFKAVKFVWGSGVSVEAKEIPGHNMPKSVEELTAGNKASKPVKKGGKK